MTDGRVRRTRLLLAVIAIVGTCAGCASTAGLLAADVAAVDPRGVVDGYIAAVNRRDLSALTAYVTPDVEWYSVANGERALEVAGREPLKKLLEQYFERYKRTRWTIERATAVNRSLAVAERSEWGDDRLESRTSLGVYEIDDGRIKRITYFLDDTQ